MSMTGRSLQLYFIDGKPDGMLTAEVFNWTGHVLMTPRTQITKALSRPQAETPENAACRAAKPATKHTTRISRTARVTAREIPQ